MLRIGSPEWGPSKRISHLFLQDLTEAIWSSEELVAGDFWRAKGRVAEPREPALEKADGERAVGVGSRQALRLGHANHVAEKRREGEFGAASDGEEGESAGEMRRTGGTSRYIAGGTSPD